MRMTAENVEARFRASLDKRPGLTLRLDIINKCNLRCIMCYFSDETVFKRPTRKMAPQEFRELYADIAPYVGRVVLSCGDEPLVSNHFPEILSHLGDGFPELEIEFCTNAMLMNARIRSLLIEKGVTHLLLSMDGTTRETLERIRVGAKYDKVVANIAALRDLKAEVSSRFPVLVMDYVMMRSNVHETPAFVGLCKRLGMELIDFRHVIPSVYFDDPDEQLANHPAVYNHFRRLVLKEARKHKIDVVMPPAFGLEASETSGVSVDDFPAVDLSDFESVEPAPHKGELPVPKAFPRRFKARQPRGTVAAEFASTYCERPFSEIRIDENQNIKPCAWHHESFGNIEQGDSLADAFFGDDFQRLRRHMLRPEGDPGCSGCPIKAQHVRANITQFGRSPRDLLRKAGNAVRRALG